MIARRRMRSSEVPYTTQLRTHLGCQSFFFCLLGRCLLVHHCQAVTNLEGALAQARKKGVKIAAQACSRLSCTRHIRCISRAAPARFLRDMGKEPGAAA